jgi:hypothetical protein
MSNDLLQHRARNYPYDRAAHSFVFDGGEVLPLGDGVDDFLVGKHPVLAFGSNAAPEQLQRKYRDWPDVRFVVTRATLQDYDVVYSAHLTSYGAVPATLASSPGTELQTWVTWLDDEQLAHMHTTEMGPGKIEMGGGADVNYAYGHLRDVTLNIEDIEQQVTAVGVYLSNYGALALADGPLAFSRIKATDRTFEARDKISVLEEVRDRLAPDLNLEDFIVAIVAEPASRSRWGTELKATAHALEFPDFVRLVP